MITKKKKNQGLDAIVGMIKSDKAPRDLSENLDREILKRTAGIWKETLLDNDSLWRRIFKRRSRGIDKGL